MKSSVPTLSTSISVLTSFHLIRVRVLDPVFQPLHSRIARAPRRQHDDTVPHQFAHPQPVMGPLGQQAPMIDSSGATNLRLMHGGGLLAQPSVSSVRLWMRRLSA